MNVIELILASLIPTATIIIGLLYIRRSMPKLIQSVLNDVGTQLNEIFANPTIKKAYSHLGKMSGEVRADNALREKAANAFVGQSPVIEKVLDQFGFTALEGVQLLNDPIFGSMIQGTIDKFMKNLSTGSGKTMSGLP